MQTNTKRITESAMLIAMALVLELLSKAFIPEMPFGGQVTLASMLPVILISYRHGVKWGLAAGLGYAFMEMILGARTVAAAFQPGYFGDGRMIANALAMCLMDYVPMNYLYLMNYGWRFVILYRRQGSRSSLRREMQKCKMTV